MIHYRDQAAKHPIVWKQTILKLNKGYYDT